VKEFAACPSDRTQFDSVLSLSTHALVRCRFLANFSPGAMKIDDLLDAVNNFFSRAIITSIASTALLTLNPQPRRMEPRATCIK
jgi:hypothetical protein